MPTTKHRGQDADIPVSPIYIIEHKLGFKPVLGCRCGARLDTNKATYRERHTWTWRHELCEVSHDT